MKKIILTLVLIIVATFSLTACITTVATEEDKLSPEYFRNAIQIRAAAECYVKYGCEVVSVTVATKTENSDGSYSAQGYITVHDSYGDSYKSKYNAEVSIKKEEDSEEFTCTNLDMETPIKE